MLVKVELNIPSFEVPGNQRAVMSSGIDQLVLSVIGNAHNIVQMAMKQMKFLEE